mmetsp:Transcript_1339/g.2682  ORF Transcript_1339/g.2682 Transcript_1339/m.2682 type:complete len:356 (+) Transcript_1339:233-1300(+)
MYSQRMTERLDPATMPAAGRTTRITSTERNPRQPTGIWDGEQKFNRTSSKWMAPTTGRIGGRPVERLKPVTPPLRHPEYRYTNEDVDGSCPQPYPGCTIAPRVRASGLSTYFQTTRHLNPNAPMYDLAQGKQPEDCLTSPRENVQALPTWQRVDKYPRTRTMLTGNNRDPCFIEDIEKSCPGTAYALWPRKEPHPFIDYRDVHRSWPGPARHDTGHKSLYNGKTLSFCVVEGPGETRRDLREPIDTDKHGKTKWRTTPMHPLEPNYSFDPVGRSCREEMQRSKHLRNSTSAILERRAAQKPLEGELNARMEELAEARARMETGRHGVFKHNRGIVNMYLERPFKAPQPVVSGWRY